MKKIISVFMLSILLVSSPVMAEQQAEASSIVLGYTFVQGLLETIALLGAGYAIYEQYGKAVITLEEAKGSEYSSYVSSSSTNSITYHSNGVLCNATDIGGTKYVLNPKLQSALVSNNSWDLIVNSQNVYDKVGLATLAGVSGINSSHKAVVSQAMTNVASAISSVAIKEGAFVGYTVADKEAIENFTAFQACRDKVTNLCNNHPYYYVCYTVEGFKTFIEVYYSDTSPLTATTNYSGYHVRCLDGSELKYRHYMYNSATGAVTLQYYSDGTTLQYTKAILMFSSAENVNQSTTMVQAYNDVVYPYLGENTDVVVGSVVSEPVGVYEDIYDHIVNAPTDTDYIGIAEESVASAIIGNAVAGTYDVVEVDVDTIEPVIDVSDDTEYKSGILGWLQRIWDAILSIPTAIASLPVLIWEKVCVGFDSVVTGLDNVWEGVKAIPDVIVSIPSMVVSGFRDVMEWLFVPDSVAIGELVTNMENIMNERTGILTYPVTAVYNFLGKVKSMEQEDCILVLPAIEYKNYKLCDKYEYNLTELTRSDSFSKIYNIYLRITDFMMIIAVLHLASNKYNKAMEG